MIYGDRIRFRAPEREDVPIFAAWINDPEVRFGISSFLPMSIAREEGWFESMVKRPAIEHPLTIEVKEGEEWTAIGNIGFFDFGNLARKAEVGIMIGNKAYWDQGYGTEAMALILKHGFETLNLNRVFLRVFERNPRAVRCYEKVGFLHEGKLRQDVYVEGDYSDMLLMGILRSEWETHTNGANNN